MTALAVKERMTYIIMSTKLGTAKVYFTKEDLGKMLKLKDKDNLMVTDVDVDNTEGKVAITITTPMDNITNDRVRVPDGTARKRFSSKLFSELFPDGYETSTNKGFTKEEINELFRNIGDEHAFSKTVLKTMGIDNPDVGYDITKIFQDSDTREITVALNHYLERICNCNISTARNRDIISIEDKKAIDSLKYILEKYRNRL